MVGGLAEEDAGRPRPRQHPPQCPGVDPLDDERSEVGPQVERGLLEVVVKGRGEPARVTAGQRGQDLVGRVGHQRGVGPHLVVVAVERRRRHSLLRRHDHPPPRALVGDRGDHLTMPLAQRRATEEGERHVTAQFGGQHEQVVVGGAQVVQAVEGDQRRGAVGRSTGQAPGDRDGFVDPHLGTHGPAVQCGESGRRPVDDVVARGRQVARLDVRRDVGRDGDAGGGRDGEVVVQAERLVDRHERVEAVGPGRTHPEQQVDLRGGAHGEAHPAPPRRSWVEERSEASDERPGASDRASAIRANCSTFSDSPRAIGSTPAAVSAAEASSPEATKPRSAPRSALRRWANAASTTAKTCSRLAVVAGGSRRVQATRPESTLGAGQKTLRPTAPARRTSAYHAALTLGTPYTLEPGPAARRSATSACTMTRPRSSDGRRLSRWSSTGTETLYGRFATSAVGGGPGIASMRIASASTTSQRSASPPAYDVRVSGSAAASTGSTSTATTRATSSSSPRVSDPRPGPTSTTTSSGPSPAARTIRRTVLASMTKFCPRCLVGWISRRAASARTSAGPRSLGPADVMCASLWGGFRLAPRRCANTSWPAGGLRPRSHVPPW